MQMPPAGGHVWQCRSAHEGRVQSPTATDLLDGAADQHDVVGRAQAFGRSEGEFQLARSHLRFQAAQRQLHRHECGANLFQYGLELIESIFGQVLPPMREHRDAWWFRWLTALLRLELWVDQLENREFQFEPGE